MSDFGKMITDGELVYPEYAERKLASTLTAFIKNL